MHNVNEIDGHGISTLVMAAEKDNQNATITIAADSDQFWALDWVTWSYSAAPAADTGQLTIAWGGSNLIKIDITAAGPGQLYFPRPCYDATLNQVLLITLAAGGNAGTDGNISASYR